MSPLLAITILATITPSTHPATITPTITEGRTPAVAISYPTGPPPTRPGRNPLSTARGRIGLDASNPTLPTRHGYPNPGTNQLAASTRGITPTEHTNRPH